MQNLALTIAQQDLIRACVAMQVAVFEFVEAELNDTITETALRTHSKRIDQLVKKILKES